METCSVCRHWCIVSEIQIFICQQQRHCGYTKTFLFLFHILGGEGERHSAVMVRCESEELTKSPFVRARIEKGNIFTKIKYEYTYRERSFRTTLHFVTLTLNPGCRTDEVHIQRIYSNSKRKETNGKRLNDFMCLHTHIIRIHTNASTHTILSRFRTIRFRVCAHTIMLLLVRCSDEYICPILISVQAAFFPFRNTCQLNGIGFASSLALCAFGLPIFIEVGNGTCRP